MGGCISTVGASCIWVGVMASCVFVLAYQVAQRLASDTYLKTMFIASVSYPFSGVCCLELVKPESLLGVQYLNLEVGRVARGREELSRDLRYLPR